MAGRGRLGSRAGDRETVISRVAAEAVGQELLPGRTLVVDDVGERIESLLRARRRVWVRWRRWAWDGVAATPWPPEGTFDQIFLRLPRDWSTFTMQLRLLVVRLADAGRFFVYGANDEGIRSAETRLSEYFGQVRTRVAKRRARLLEARARRAELVEPCRCESFRQVICLSLPFGEFAAEEIEIVSWPGVFAAGRLDEGSACLLSVLDHLRPKGAILDYGCGHGVLSLGVRRLVPHSDLTLLDVDSLALEAARENLPGAELVLSDGWGALDSSRRFDLVLSNPPIHRGREEDFEALEALVRQAPRHLRARGSLVVVVQRTVGVGRLFARVFRRVQRLVGGTRFEVWRGYR